ncbi:hypothetical protein EHS13_13560 [Paenibacillus psychroresistens]|uniref:Uncharacterized protein n=1 Tax=Paenibacillus psychroresistens TaxID=1778678 RepID=A0A6B8RHW0_9BACL|nr:hypothetical protein [Paenibacillus psychroresistens]QGQ95830.1 hypothetical protein EHS13_13560 [Paenibacillus psychroresistens]
MFAWKNRFACLVRIVVTMKCLSLDVDSAIDRAIFKVDLDGYCYCFHPELLSELERSRLRSQAETYFIGKKIPTIHLTPVTLEQLKVKVNK